MKGDYKAIPGIGTGTFGQPGVRSRLFAGPDHLLIVQSSGYTEEYKRVFYRDLRFLVAKKSHAQLIQGISSAAFSIVLFLIFYASGVWWVGLVAAAPFVLWFVVNIVRGPTCSTFVNTDVQTLELPAPRRMAKLPDFSFFLRSKLAAEPTPPGPAVT